MLTHSEHAVVQEQACETLSNLAVNDGYRIKISGPGGIEVVVAAGEAHKTSVLVQEHACAALYILAAHDRLRQRIKTAGGV